MKTFIEEFKQWDFCDAADSDEQLQEIAGLTDNQIEEILTVLREKLKLARVEATELLGDT